MGLKLGHEAAKQMCLYDRDEDATVDARTFTHHDQERTYPRDLLMIIMFKNRLEMWLMSLFWCGIEFESLTILEQ